MEIPDIMDLLWRIPEAGLLFEPSKLFPHSFSNFSIFGITEKVVQLLGVVFQVVQFQRAVLPIRLHRFPVAHAQSALLLKLPIKNLVLVLSARLTNQCGNHGYAIDPDWRFGSRALSEGRYPDALRIAVDELARTPNHIDLRLVAAHSLLAQERPDGAKREALHVLRIDPRSHEAYRILVDVAHAHGDHARARALAARRVARSLAPYRGGLA